MNSSGKNSTRAQEIFNCLLEEYDLPKLTKQFPSVRKIRTAFRCGQNTATEALNMLAEHFHFKRIPRSKSRLTLDLSEGVSVWNDFLYQKRQCTVVMDQATAYYWQPVIDAYNQEHPSALKVRLICHLGEYAQIIDSGEADLLLLPNHPAVVGIKGGVSRFMELPGFDGEFLPGALHPAALVRDPEGAVRGIAPELVPKLLIFNKNLAGLPEKQMDIFELPQHLKKIKELNPGIRYSALFESYWGFFSNCGLNIAALPEKEESAIKCCSNAIELFRTLYKEKLVPAISDLLDFDYSLFFNGDAAMIEPFYSKIPRAGSDRYRFALSPAAEGVPYTVISEVMAIPPGSIRYEQALNFIKYVLTPPAQQLLLSRMNGFSVLNDLKPLGMTSLIYDTFAPVLSRALRSPCEDMITPVNYRFFESGIDRLIKYGGDLSRFVNDLAGQFKENMP